MKIKTRLDFQGNEIKLATPEKVTTLPDSNLFVGRTCVLISEKEVDETTISVGLMYYYNGEQWCQIEEPLKIDETKINVIDDEITVHKFDTISDAKTYINSNNKPKSLIIGSSAGVTSIATDAFRSCTSLTSINIPSSVTSIGSSAFGQCTSLESITIPSSVTSIGGAAFRDCTSLESITIPSGVTNINTYAFSNCTALKPITIPDGVTIIGGNAFWGCTSLTSVTIPDSVISIGYGAFRDCTSLTSITIPDTVTSINSHAFDGCDILILEDYKSRIGYPWGATDILIQNEDVTTTLDSNSTDRQVPTAKTVYDTFSLDQTKINVIDDEITLHKFDTLSDAVTYIKSNSKPKSLIIGSNAGITSISSGAFANCTSLTSINIPSSVTSIGSSAFVNCASLTSINIPDGVTKIGNGVFFNCISLASINIPDGVTKIGNGVFFNCISLTSINIPSSVTSIGDGAFSQCKSLKSIVISSGTSIGSNAFQNCTSLTYIYISDSVISISSSAFTGCDILLLDNYKSRTGYPWGATNILIQNEAVTTTINENSTDRQVPTANSVYNFIMENMFSIKIDMEYLKEYIERTITSIDIPDGITSIGDWAFYGCRSLTSVTIPDSVTSIGEMVFTESSLTSITIPSSVTSIDSDAFLGSSLTSITINKPEGSISGSPWGSHATITWNG